MKDYMTDEELELFIEHMEQRELYAPKHMKEQILNQAFPKQTVEVLPKSGGGICVIPSRLSSLSYSHS